MHEEAEEFTTRECVSIASQANASDIPQAR
jgi:hypothetical protein